MINAGVFAKAMYPGVKNWVQASYDEHPMEWEQIFSVESSKRRYEEDVGQSTLGLAQIKNEGGKVFYDTMKQGFQKRYTPYVSALGFIVTREAMEDDLYGVVAKNSSEQLGISMRQTKEINGANVLNRGFNSSYTGWDGLTLFNTAHLHSGTSATYSNRSSTDADFSELAIEQACITIGKWTDDRGKKMVWRPQKLIIPVDLEFDVDRIMNSELQAGSANNDRNSVRALGKIPGGIHVNHFLTDTDAWFVKTDEKHGLKHIVRRKLEMTIDNEFDTENAKFKATERYDFDWTNPKGMYASPGS